MKLYSVRIIDKSYNVVASNMINALELDGKLWENDSKKTFYPNQSKIGKDNISQSTEVLIIDALEKQPTIYPAQG